MNRSSTLCLVFILTLIFTISCSGGSGNVIAPGPGERDVVSDAQNNGMLCSGLWQIAADKATGNVDVVQLRSADKILNVLGFMEPPPLTNMDLDWADLDIDFVNNTIDVGVILKHPIPDDVFTGFDVRGVCFGPEVTNADGLTILTGPEYFSGEPFGYMDGLLGAPDSFGHYTGLAGYKYYCADIGEDDVLSDFFTDAGHYADRGKFPAGGVIQRNYNLAWEGTGYDILVFNYAIYANYDWPIGSDPWDVDDWSITAANNAEVFCCSVTELANSLWWSGGTGGGDISLMIELWDWQGDITDVTIESLEAGIIAQTTYDTDYTNNYGTFTTYIYDFYGAPASPTSIGDLDILITATDSRTFGECWFLDMLSTGNSMYSELVYNCFIHTTNVIECPVPTVTGTYMGAGIIDDKSIYCTNLIDGPSLAVNLTDGTTDYVGTDVQYVSGTELTADFDLTAATFGDILDVEITNGCGTEGSATGVWEVYHWIYPITPYNIDTLTGIGDPVDITCNPVADQVAISYDNPRDWYRWDTDYTVPNNYAVGQGRLMGYIDSQSWGLFVAETTGSSTTLPVWGWVNWANSWNGNHWWFGSSSFTSYDMASVPGQNTVWDCYDFTGSFYYFIGANAWGQMNYFMMCGAPMYGGSGTTGIVPSHFIAAEGAPSSYRHLYILEDLPTTSTAVVEKWDVGSRAYQNWSAGEDLLVVAIDVTTRADGVCFVLEKDGDGDPNIWAFSATDGSLIGKSGKIGSSVMSGDPLRMDAFLFSDPDEVHVLHSDGVTMFGM